MAQSMNIFKKAVELIFNTGTPDDSTAALLRKSAKTRPLRGMTKRQLIQLESKVGAALFGELPKHIHRREFFNLDERTWIWHEEFTGEGGKREELTTRYEVQDRGILKVQPGYKYSYLEGEELRNFVVAVSDYYEQVAREIYQRDPRTGHKLTSV